MGENVAQLWGMEQAARWFDIQQNAAAAGRHEGAAAAAEPAPHALRADVSAPTFIPLYTHHRIREIP